MRKRGIPVLFFLLPLLSFSQENAFRKFLTDSSMVHASVSFYITDPDSIRPVLDYNSEKSLNPASVLKLITSAASLEMLGPDHRFRTTIGYTGNLNRRSGRLNGNIIIKGGGDPVLGSKNFGEHYSGFADGWVEEIRKLGIKKIAGRVITDDSYFDYLPVPAKWLLEDTGNPYGAGAYGLSVFDNTYEVHLMNTPDTLMVNASIADPPLIMAGVLDQKLKDSGINVSGEPTTTRLLQSSGKGQFIPVSETVSPPLKEIIEVMNHESINLYAEHLLKELGRVFEDTGSTESGIKVVKKFLLQAGIDIKGMFIEDGSGLSPLNAINSASMISLLSYMKKNGKYFNDFFNSLPEAGSEGTLKNYFRDPVFYGRIAAKSGSMTRVKNYAGYITTFSGNELIFCILVNNYNGPVQNLISNMEEILKETIKNR